MSKKKRILLEVAKGGISQSTIAAALCVSKRDVSAAAQVIKEHNLSYSDIVLMDDKVIEDTFFPKKPRQRCADYLQPDISALIERKEKNRKLPVKLFWYEHCEQAQLEGKLAYSYQAFCEIFAEESEKSGAAMHFNHIFAEKAFVDWAGDCACITDKILGKKTKIYVLVITLPASGYIWARGFTDMKKQSWLIGHMEAFEEFGGTPRLLIPDNCATATDRTSTYVTSLNADYKRMAQHYNCAIVPARIRAPRDKNTAESSVNLIEEWIIAPSNEYTFYTLDEFNEYCKERITWLNNRPFSDKEGSRRTLFEESEKDNLTPLPAERFEICEWRVCKVAPNYHIRFDYMHYSLPHTFIGKSVDVRISATKVTIFFNNEQIAEHKRLYGRKNQYSTVFSHMPDNHQNLTSPWSKNRFISWAEKIGPETKKVIERVLNSKVIVQQTFIACLNILGLSKQYGAIYLEQACKKVNDACALPSYSGLKTIILNIKSEQANEKVQNKIQVPDITDKAKSAGRVRGANAYKRGGGSTC